MPGFERIQILKLKIRFKNLQKNKITIQNFGVSKLKFNQKSDGGLGFPKSQFSTPKMRHFYTPKFKNLQKIKITIKNFESMCFRFKI